MIFIFNVKLARKMNQLEAQQAALSSERKKDYNSRWRVREI